MDAGSVGVVDVAVVRAKREDIARKRAWYVLVSSMINLRLWGFSRRR